MLLKLCMMWWTTQKVRAFILINVVSKIWSIYNIYTYMPHTFCAGWGLRVGRGLRNLGTQFVYKIPLLRYTRYPIWYPSSPFLALETVLFKKGVIFSENSWLFLISSARDYLFYKYVVKNCPIWLIKKIFTRRSPDT